MGLKPAAWMQTFLLSLMGACDSEMAFRGPVCIDCHARGPTHAQDKIECPICRRPERACCMPYCCDTRFYVCGGCGKEARQLWPAGGPLKDGLQMSIKPMGHAYKAGETIEIVAKITNTADKEWVQRSHSYYHGGFKDHTCWTAESQGRTIGNWMDVVYTCPQWDVHLRRKRVQQLAPHQSAVFRIEAWKGYDDGDVDLQEVFIGGEGEYLLWLSELVIPLESNRLKIVVEK